MRCMTAPTAVFRRVHLCIRISAATGLNLAGHNYREEAASIRMLASLLHTSASALCVTDALADDHPILWVNRVFLQATGYSADEVRQTTADAFPNYPDG